MFAMLKHSENKLLLVNNANQGLKIGLDYQQIINQRLMIFEFEKL